MKNWLGGHSHSGFLQKYGENLRVTHTTQIQLFGTCDTVAGMTCHLHGWTRTEARKRVSSGQVSSFKQGGRPCASACGARSIKLHQASSDQKGPMPDWQLAYGHPPTLPPSLRFGATGRYDAISQTQRLVHPCSLVFTEIHRFRGKKLFKPRKTRTTRKGQNPSS